MRSVTLCVARLGGARGVRTHEGLAYLLLSPHSNKKKFERSPRRRRDIWQSSSSVTRHPLLVQLHLSRAVTVAQLASALPCHGSVRVAARGCQLEKQCQLGAVLL